MQTSFKPFNPQPGRIVMVRFDFPQTGARLDRPAIIVQDFKFGTLRLSIQTGDPSNPVKVEDASPYSGMTGLGWYRPADWPEPTDEAPSA